MREKETNADPVNVKIQKDAYIEMLSTIKSLLVSKDECSKNQTQDKRSLIVILITIAIVLFNEQT